MLHKEYLKLLLSKGQLEQAIQELLTATNKNKQKSLHGDIIHQSGRNSDNETQKRDGLIDNGFYMLTRNQIRRALENLLEDYIDEGQSVIQKTNEDVKMEAKTQFVPLLQKKESVKISYTETHFDDIQYIIDKGLILLVTATDTETNALHQQLTPLDGESTILETQPQTGAFTYYIGKFGNYAVAHVECGDMGSSSSLGSITTVLSAIDNINPKFVLMVGIAFGVDGTKQNIGDVLVSKTIITYESQRIGDNDVWRGIKSESSSLLRNCFKNNRDWEYILPNNEKAKAELCDILSGEKLIDDIEYRKELQKKFESAKGGEMEGTGLYAACQTRNGVNWILVKAICDFADGDKGKGKKEKQALAIDVALSVCLHIFNKKLVFQALGVKPYEINEKKIANSKIEMYNKIENQQAIEFLESGKIPELFKLLDNVEIDNKFRYNRFKDEYQDNLKGIDLSDWIKRMKVFIHELK